MSELKTYLGDSVYYDFHNGLVQLTTENGVVASNEIFIGPEEISCLLRVLCRDFGRDAIVATLPGGKL